MRKTAAYAFHHSIPILIGFFPVGIAYGLLMQQAGYNFLWSGACSLFVLAGSLQFLMVTFFAGGVSLATVAVLALLSWLATRRLRDVPGPLQNAAEMAVEKLQGFYGGILGPANARRYFPMMATFFIFIVVSNYIGLLPGAGEVFTVPTATLSVTAGLAIIAFCMTHTVGIQRRGLGGYLKSFIKPFLLMLPLNLIEQIVRPFSLALRLYGNLYGEEMVTHELGNLFPLVLPLLMQVLSLLFCLIQAVVFTMLLSIYIEEAIEE